MDYDDSSNYIRHRLNVAGGGGWIDFTPAAMNKIFKFAKGSPRLINLACDRALLIGYTEDTGNISAVIATAAIKELENPVRRQILRPKLEISVLLALLLLSIILLCFMKLTETRSAATSGHSLPAPKVHPPSGTRI
jgi:general secretion pathway protein A